MDYDDFSEDEDAAYNFWIDMMVDDLLDRQFERNCEKEREE